MPRKKQTVIEETELDEEVEVVEAEPVDKVPWELQDFLTEAIEKKFKIVYRLFRYEEGKEFHLKTYYNHIPDEEEIYQTFGHRYPIIEFRAKVAYWDTVKKKRCETSRVINIDRSWTKKPLNGSAVQVQPQQPDYIAGVAELVKAMAPLFQGLQNNNGMNFEILNQMQRKSFESNMRQQGEMLAWQRELGNQQAHQGDATDDDRELAEIAIDLVLSKIGEWTGLDGIGKKIAARRIKKTPEFAELKDNPNAVKIMCEQLDTNEAVGPDAVNEFLKYLKVQRPE